MVPCGTPLAMAIGGEMYPLHSYNILCSLVEEGRNPLQNCMSDSRHNIL